MTTRREGQAQLTMWLPEELHRRLREAAGGRGMSDFVRGLIESALAARATVGGPATGGAQNRAPVPVVSELAGEVERAADALAEVYEPSCGFYWEALAAALAKIIELHRRQAEPGVRATEDGETFFGPAHPIGEAVTWALAGARHRG